MNEGVIAPGNQLILIRCAEHHPYLRVPFIRMGYIRGASQNGTQAVPYGFAGRFYRSTAQVVFETWQAVSWDVDDIGLDGRFAPRGKAYGCSQFANWLPQDATGILHLDGFESYIRKKEHHPTGGVLFWWTHTC